MPQIHLIDGTHPKEGLEQSTATINNAHYGTHASKTGDSEVLELQLDIGDPERSPRLIYSSEKKIDEIYKEFKLRRKPNPLIGLEVVVHKLGEDYVGFSAKR